MRTWKRLMGAAVLAAALAAPAMAAEPTIADVMAQMKKLSDDFGAMKKGLEADFTRFGSDITTLRNELEDLRKEVRTGSVRGGKTATDLLDLQRRVDEVQAQCKKDTESLRRSFSYTPGATNGNGGSDTTGVPASPPPPAMGTIYLRNYSDVNGTFLVNGAPYPVLAGQTAVVRNVPAGAFNYEIQAEGFGVIRPLTTRMLPAGGTYNLNMNPQPTMCVAGP